MNMPILNLSSKSALAAVLLLTLLACQQEAPVWHGYVEADALRVAAPVSGRLQVLTAERGQSVRAGQALFVLEPDNEQAALQEAQARERQAQAQAADLAQGQRPEELAVLAAAVQAAQAQAQQSAQNLARQTPLVQQGFLAPATLDALRAQHQVDVAHVAQLQAQWRSAQLAARPQTRVAAAANAEAAHAQARQRQWLLTQKTVIAPVSALVEDRYFQVGEWVPMHTPVLSLLPADALKIRFWVAEPQRARFSPGTVVQLRCDGCAQPLRARVTFLAREAEFTPPVIYSKDQRAKLVFLVEAQPQAPWPAALHPGLPVEVSLP